jgi:hypothetical protein
MEYHLAVGAAIEIPKEAISSVEDLIHMDTKPQTSTQTNEPSHQEWCPHSLKRTAFALE